MDDHRFWRLIQHVDGDALRGGDEESAVATLREALAALPRKELEGFAETLAHKLFALDGRRWADEAGDSGTSSDGFLYARCFVVACGKEHYDRVLADPTKMTKSIDEWCESLLYVAVLALEEGRGEEWTFLPSVSYETGSNEALWAKS